MENDMFSWLLYFVYMFSRWTKKSSYKELSLNELLLTYRQSHDRECINELSNRYLHLIFTNCLAILKDEVKSKEASIQILEKISLHLTENEIYFFETWLSKVCRNHCLNMQRAEKKNTQFKNDYASFQKKEYDIFEEEEKIWKAFEKDPKIEQLLDEVIQKLKPIQQRCLQLFYFQHLTYQEIAAQENMNIKSVKSHLQNGRRNLKNLLSERDKNKPL